jgi:hypothetical protein
MSDDGTVVGDCEFGVDNRRVTAGNFASGLSGCELAAQEGCLVVVGFVCGVN